MAAPTLGFVVLFLLCVAGKEGGESDDPKALPAKQSNSTSSSLAKFLEEPKLGTSWYDPRGPTPNFVANQTNGTSYATRLGGDALLDCRVTALEEDLVSWSRLERGGVPVVLTVGFRPHSAENRFLLDFEPPNNYRLRIQSVQWRDAGVYLCQLSVHPPALMWSRLTLVRPVVHLLDGDGKPVRDLHYDSGTTIEMQCRVRRPPLYHTSVQWEVTYVDGGEVAVLNQDVTRGGVKVVTGRDADSGQVVSRLSLARARASDTGNYTCRLVILPREAARRTGLKDTVSLHVLRGENTEAIQSRGGGGPRASFLAPLLVFMIADDRVTYSS